MAEPIPNTEPQNPGGTGGAPQGQPPAEPPAATPPAQGGGAASGEEKTVTIKESDYKNLIGGRDRSNEELSTAMSYIERQAQKEGIEGFLSEHKDEYPDITPADLSHVMDPNDLETEAKRLQDRLQAHAQAKILEIENPASPRETPEQRAAREAKLAENPSTSTWEQVLAGRMQG